MFALLVEMEELSEDLIDVLICLCEINKTKGRIVAYCHLVDTANTYLEV